MKKSILYVFFGCLLVLSACKKDDKEESEVQAEPGKTISLIETANDKAINEKEKQAISTTVLANGIVLSDVIKKTGKPAASTVDLGMTLSDTDVEGFQNSGFKIGFDADSSITGAYFLIKDVDGNYVDGYYDVNVNSLYNSNSSNLRRQTSIARVATSNTQNSEYVLEVQFNETIPAGRFCGELCVYNANGVGVIQTVCIEVESWGGLEGLVNEYVVKEQNLYADGVVALSEVNERGDSWFFVFNADGTYYELYDKEYRVDGKWAYDEEDQTLTVIDFSATNLTTNEVEYSPEGSFYFDRVNIIVVGNEMTLSKGLLIGGVTYLDEIIFKIK